MTSIRLEKRGNSWQYSFEGARIAGKRQRVVKGGFRTKSEAMSAGNKALSEYLKTGTYSAPSTMSFSDFLDSWMEEYCYINLKQGSYENYAKRIRIHIKPVLGKYPLSAINASTLQEFINNKAKESYSRNTLSVIKGILSGALNYAVKLNLINFNPMYCVKLPSSRNEHLTLRSAPNCYIEQEEIDKIFERFPYGSSVYIPLLLGYKCGLRLGEAYGVTWDNVDFEKNLLTINKQVQWNPDKDVWYFTAPKYNSFRTIEVDNDTMDVLKGIRQQQERAKVYYDKYYIIMYEDEHRVINTDKNGVPIELINVREDGSYIQPRTMQHASRIIHYALNYPDFTFHSLRHTHATMLAENNAPPKYVKERLGHKNVQVTMQVYQHLTKKISANGTEILQNMYKK